MREFLEPDARYGNEGQWEVRAIKFVPKSHNHLLLHFELPVKISLSREGGREREGERGLRIRDHRLLASFPLHLLHLFLPSSALISAWRWKRRSWWRRRRRSSSSSETEEGWTHSGNKQQDYGNRSPSNNRCSLSPSFSPTLLSLSLMLISWTTRDDRGAIWL